MIETVVIDVSGIIEILFRKEKMDDYINIINESELVITPNLYIPELTNTLWKYVKKNIYTEEECIQYIKDGIAYIDHFIDSKKLWQEALSEGIKNDHSIYDIFYMICARRENATMLTCDNDLIKICRKNDVKAY